MMTMFTIPCAFVGEHATRQWNAVGSWVSLQPRPEIVLFCDDAGIGEMADRVGCIHIPVITRGTDDIPLVSDAFIQIPRFATRNILCYANADIIFTQSLVKAIRMVSSTFFHFLMIGQRWNVAVDGPIDFSGDWQARLNEGELSDASAIDYFVYRVGSLGGALDMPDFLVGSPAWDNWLVGYAVEQGIPVIDATDVILCIHQKHDKLWPRHGVVHNRTIQGTTHGIISDATWKLNQEGLWRI